MPRIEFPRFHESGPAFALPSGSTCRVSCNETHKELTATRTVPRFRIPPALLNASILPSLQYLSGQTHKPLYEWPGSESCRMHPNTTFSEGELETYPQGTHSLKAKLE